MTDDLFAAAAAPDDVLRPLAVRMRPETLDEVVGQQHVLGDGSPLRRLADPQSQGSLTAPSSIILFGPPGVGKTTLAYIVAKQSGRAFEELSAVTSGVKDVRAVLERAHERLVTSHKETVLFIDEVHRFSKSQQDALLPSVENRDVTFIGATTENPSFSVIKPLLSRSVVVKLESLDDADLSTLIDRAIASPRGLEGTVAIDDDARDEIIRMGGGDGRKTLTILEAAAGAVTGGKHAKDPGKPAVITPDIVSSVMDVATVRYDKHGDDHYDVISAFIKSMRGSDPDAAIHYLAQMLRAGEDPRFIARRIMIAAAEEVGMAAPQILQVTVAAAQAVAMIGMPEARIILAEATIAVATAPKSNASYNAINEALADIDAGHIGQVPLYLRNAPTKLMKSWGNHEGYKYAHDYPGAVAPQQYMPDELVGREYYRPNDRGYERQVKENLARIKPILHGIGAARAADAAGTAGTAGAAGTAGTAGTGAQPASSESGRTAQAEPGAELKKQHAAPQSESAASHTSSDATPQTD